MHDYVNVTEGCSNCCTFKIGFKRPSASVIQHNTTGAQSAMDKTCQNGNPGLHFFLNFQREFSDATTCVEEYNKEENVRRYEEALSEVDFTGHMYCADMLSAVVPDKDALILDLCAGTGAVGNELRKKGYTNIHGQDGSMKMLDFCKEKGLFKEYVCCFLSEGMKMPITDGFYDAMTVCGGVCPHHLPPGIQQELIRVIKPGGYFINSYRQPVLKLDYGKAWQKETERLEREGKWHLYGKLMFKKYNFRDDGVVDIYQIA